MNRKTIIINSLEVLVLISFSELAIHYLRPYLVHSLLSRLSYLALLFVCLKSIMFVFNRLSS